MNGGSYDPLIQIGQLITSPEFTASSPSLESL